jgi:hypothetical protein
VAGLVIWASVLIVKDSYFFVVSVLIKVSFKNILVLAVVLIFFFRKLFLLIN